MGYPRRTLNYPKRIILSDLTHMMSLNNLVPICVETIRIDSGFSLQKEFTKLICKNPKMISYLIVNHIVLFHGCICDPLT